MGKQHDTQHESENHNEAADKDTVKKSKSVLEGFGSALSNDENGFSNQEGFNKDGEHQNLAEDKSDLKK